ncbi:DUF995 domain-containing protein [Chelativorans alearense]|uniref:DUF995 domain-containing protein n=1 Tax=Chelativorans alearense TaxID=2681495 RepID=UPI0013D6471A|nr:DUF995 domain-containing protein [Chelativorans alearense]
MSLHRIALVAAVIAGLGGNTSSVAAQAREAADIDKARPLTSSELYELYNSRSWLWKAGAGHFAVKERQFTAYSNEGGSPSYGIGRWFITAPGKLCFRATWHAADGTAPAVTCFSHREVDGAIYQKREPDGEWSVFRNARPRRSDEWAKLRHGDYVAKRMSRIKASLADR